MPSERRKPKICPQMIVGIGMILKISLLSGFYIQKTMEGSTMLSMGKSTISTGPYIVNPTN
jgi:hypothetical protein